MTSVSGKGRFITFEGGEGAGKSTQIDRLAERLRGLGLSVVTTREPGGSPRAEAIRTFILSGQAQSAGPLAEAMLFAAARISHIDTTIGPALTRGEWVLCDRFVDSTRVYQGVVGEVPLPVIEAAERVVLDGLVIDLTVLIDLPAETGLARAGRRRRAEAPDRFEKEQIETHRRIRDAYLALAARDPARFLVVDGSADPRTVSDAIWRGVATRLALQPKSADGGSRRRKA